jgi:predicted RNA-binding Zn-ribbon protein involved in translation (DUF1610 family)
MLQQLQCPNCGGYKTRRGSESNIKGSLGNFLVGFFQLEFLVRSKPTNDYYCSICGFHWVWEEGTPYPPITVRPDLIAKGEEHRRRLD